ncbi:hypothetical protein MRB53_022275 [Persea americana]|uniref:Uncharacterized protein n=1 Tax=Persea americana TaxID=3435 RepID=A0ACC2L781_PERAE|nr:hypothetical protein MRB53_022275 [Persea americana]
MGSLKDSMPTIAMSLLQFGFAVVTLSTRTALAQGMSPRVFVVYRQAIATLFVAPIAYILNRLENVNIRSSRSLGKVLGTIVCILGGTSMALLKGHKLLNTESPIPPSVLSSRGENWLLGCVYLFGSCCCGSIWLILQVPMYEIYPDHLSISAWMCFFAMLQSGVLTYFLEPNPRAWNLSSNTEILTCFFAGIIGSGVSYYIQSWSISRRGPLFSAMFSPLMTVIVTILACLFLHEELYIGSLVGAIAVVAGLYAVLWGRDNDTETRGDKISGDDGVTTPFIADTNNC